jgi:O-acetyl-ADP-ribose deacetylase (regulator of RNase III)
MNLSVVLVAQKEPLATVWDAIAKEFEFVTVHRGSIFEVEADAYVSPANSFGFLNGGIDLLYARHFGASLEERLQSTIREQHHGELLVGSAVIVPTNHTSVPYLIAAPTMRMPMSVKFTVNAYLAMRAVLLLWKFGTVLVNGAEYSITDVVRRIAVPGLCTGIGAMEPAVCARQVRAAIENVLFDQFIYPSDWGGVLQQHEEFLGHEIPGLV